jgi:hypothetical protein
MSDEIHQFSSGAKSSGRKPRYDLIPAHALERIARRFELGAEKYGVNNWKKGADDKDFILDRINHAIEHLLIMKDRIHDDEGYGSAVDDDAAAVCLNAIFVMEHQNAAARR